MMVSKATRILTSFMSLPFGLRQAGAIASPDIGRIRAIGIRKRPYHAPNSPPTILILAKNRFLQNHLENSFRKFPNSLGAIEGKRECYFWSKNPRYLPIGHKNGARVAGASRVKGSSLVMAAKRVDEVASRQRLIEMEALDFDGRLRVFEDDELLGVLNTDRADFKAQCPRFGDQLKDLLLMDGVGLQVEDKAPIDLEFDKAIFL